jgi:4-azaleucine resistance transporter AzlC
MGYTVLGFAFGLLAVSSGLKWYIALLMSFVIYAGALQFLAVSLLSVKAGFLDIFIASLMVNLRQSFYGLSLLQKFKKAVLKPYLIFALTDETYALLTTIKTPDDIKKKWYYFYLGMLNQSYWISGTAVGSLFGSSVHFNTKGLDFSLTALFVVLAIEQYKQIKKLTPFVLGGVVSILGFIIVPKSDMLVFSIALALLGMFLLKNRIEYD